MQTIETAYNYGYCAFYTFQKRDNNPFTGLDFILWIQGYVQAEIDYQNEN